MGSYFERYLQHKEAAQHRRIRKWLRIGGSAALLLGVGLLIHGIVGTIKPPVHYGFVGRSGPPWGIFLGLPLIFVGINMLHAGFLKAITTYVAGEKTPPIAQSARYVADEIAPTVRAIIHPRIVSADHSAIRLKRLEALRQKNLISEEEYTAKRAEILKEL